MANTNIHHDGFKPSPSELESNQVHSYPHPSTGPYKNMWKERLPFDLTELYPNILRLKQLCQYLLKNTKPTEINPTELTENTAQRLSTAIMTAYNKQGKWVTTNPERSKEWWDKSQLDELFRLQNQARRKLLKHKTNKTKKDYHYHQQQFKQKFWELKTNHWRRFLGKKGPEHAYWDYKLTKYRQLGGINPIRDREGNLTFDVTTKVSLIFHGTSIAETSVDLRDIPNQ
ncbi:hypothetical protein O181_083862 [Austropuccinia psidii MF-1]|uniref:Uncharacterized protein n=1 Tax=Austropuccinia psidii MF-1 TaxID=1389203 RepID=A0A9Q3FT47_9BASI|nr:hypothetical protein [Austropuccinia psidii MF-1]